MVPASERSRWSTDARITNKWDASTLRGGISTTQLRHRTSRGRDASGPSRGTDHYPSHDISREDVHSYIITQGSQCRGVEVTRKEYVRSCQAVPAPLDLFGGRRDLGSAIPLERGSNQSPVPYCYPLKEVSANPRPGWLQYHHNGSTGDLRVNQDGSNCSVGKKKI